MRRYRWILPIAAGWFLTGCGGTSDDGDDATTTAVGGLSVTASQPVTLPVSYQPNDGRLLASQCFQCHGTNGYSTNGWDSIVGEMDDFYENEHPLMTAQARGYTAQEVNAIAMWLGGEGDEYEGGDDDNDGDDEDEYGEYEHEDDDD